MLNDLETATSRISGLELETENYAAYIVQKDIEIENLKSNVTQMTQYINIGSKEFTCFLQLSARLFTRLHGAENLLKGALGRDDRLMRSAARRFAKWGVPVEPYFRDVAKEESRPTPKKQLAIEWPQADSSAMGVSVDIHSQAYIDSLYDLEPDYTPPSTAPTMEEEAEEEPASTSNSAAGREGDGKSSVTNQGLLAPLQAQLPGLDTTSASTEAGATTPGASMATRKQEMPVESVRPVAQETLGAGTFLERLVPREATWPSYAERFGARGDSWQGRGRTAEEILACYNENFRETTAPPTS